jgi:hypothetical protein
LSTYLLGGGSVSQSNLAARASRWSAQDWKSVTGVWLGVFVAVVLILGQLAGAHKLSDNR